MRGELEMEETEPWHDPELPFLDVLGQEVRRRAERAALVHQQRQHRSFSGTSRSDASITARRAGALDGPASATIAATPSRSTRRRDAVRGSLRIARRSVTLMMLLCLIGASAYGASEVFSKAPASPLGGRPSAFAVVAAGGSGSETWQLRLYARSGELCRTLEVSETEASDCADAPSPTAVEATSAESPSRRYLFGIAGAKVMGVRVRVAGASVAAATHAPAPSLLRTDGLPSHVRYYVVAFARPDGGTDPRAEVEGLSATGRLLGAPVPSCLETGESGRC